MTLVIETNGLTKRYGKRRGLDGLDLEVREGEVFGFLGPNGAGKTTTIRLLLDLIRPTSGTARVLGQDPRTAGKACADGLVSLQATSSSKPTSRPVSC